MASLGLVLPGTMLSMLFGISMGVPSCLGFGFDSCFDFAISRLGGCAGGCLDVAVILGGPLFFFGLDQPFPGASEQYSGCMLHSTYLELVSAPLHPAMHLVSTSGQHALTLA